ncbi:MAG: NarK/NasA family nitrate transporter [Myxococcales bacterium]|nr:NarK/NasA family nitrate transporter [Myxococcales bacterium]
MSTADARAAGSPTKATGPAPFTPEDATFWAEKGKRVAWRTLAVTTFCLLLAFATWFMVSAVAVKLTGIGFAFTTQQLFWITAMPGLAAGILRMVHTFLIPILGTRTTVAVSTLLLLAPSLGWGLAVQSPGTPYWVFLVLAFVAGLGGGNFSSFMPSTSLFFPKRLQGTALGVQAGIGNFGVSVTQFLTPAILGVALLGSALGAPQTFTAKDGKTTEIYLQNAAFIWAPFIVCGALAAWIWLRSVPVKASFRQQLDIFGNKHTWLMTSLYVMTFGSFSGYSAAFPLLIDKVYGKFPGAPQPLKYAFLGPLIGAAIRALAGPIADKFGGAKVTLVSGLGLCGCALAITPFTSPESLDQWPGFLGLMLGLFLFSGIGNASTFKQMPMIFEPRQAGGVIGFTSAIAAFGPFLFSVAFGAIIAATGSPTAFFFGAAVFYALNVGLNWWFYTRKGAEKPC